MAGPFEASRCYLGRGSALESQADRGGSGDDWISNSLFHVLADDYFREDVEFTFVAQRLC